MSEKLERESEGKASGGEIVMDTPERGRITTSLSKFEDSPVFNYINNLSPLETVKPVRISQTLNSYSFSSVPSIFTSPHVSSLKETTFLRRYSVSSPSNPTCFSENGNKVCSNEGFAHKSEGQKGIFDPGGCIFGLNKRKVENGGLQNQNYGPNDSAVTCHDTEASNNDQSKEGGSFGWEAISDAADFLIFESPDNADPFKASFLKPLDSETRLHVPVETLIDINGTEKTLVQTSEGQLNVTEAAGDVLALTRVNNQVAEVSNEVVANDSASNLPRGIRRRCLVYDMGGARRKFLDDGATSSSSSKCHVTSSKNHLVLTNPDTSSSRCIVPGIGLHLNALARTSNACTANYQEDLAATPRRLINDLSSNAAPDLSVNTQETINQSLVLNSVDRDVGSVDVDVCLTEDAYQLSGFVGSDDPNQSNQKKRKVENGGETESCKRCNCKKSKCLKLYCECFAAGVYCVEPCSCQDCFNKPIHEETVLATRKQIESRNPLAFAPKVIRTTDLVLETADELSSTPASARHKRGCNCKKSGCLKKYCECYQGGVGCSINCRCEGCKNAFGRKDGSQALLLEGEGEGEVTEKHEKSVVDRNLSKHSAEPNPDSILPETPMHSNRAPMQHPFSSKSKPPRSFLSTGSSSSTLYGRQKFGIPAFLQPHQEIEKRVPTSLENEIPEILQSPISGIKSSSPNSKRVSPPHTNTGSSLSPARRSSRKLILQSIPSFPSLKD